MSENQILTAGSESDYRFVSRSPYTDVFNKWFPYFLSIGMTEEQFWDKDSTLVGFYREAEKLRREKKNQELWLQGMYVYDAISRLSPVLRPFSKKGTKAQPYPEEPYPIDKKTQDDIKARKEKQEETKAKRFMEAYMVKVNRYFEERK